VDVYLQPEGLLMGTATMQKEAQERLASVVRQKETGRREREFELKRKTLEGQIAALQAELGSQEEEFRNFRLQRKRQQDIDAQEKVKMAGLRKAD
jgi:circadian clock protein KaiC